MSSLTRFAVPLLLALVVPLTGCGSMGGSGTDGLLPGTGSASTPEKAYRLQRDAMLTGDLQTAYDMRCEEIRSRQTFAQFRDAFYFKSGYDRRMRLLQTATLENVVYLDDRRAVLTVLAGDGSRRDILFVKEGGSWREAGTPIPAELAPEGVPHTPGYELPAWYRRQAEGDDGR